MIEARNFILRTGITAANVLIAVASGSLFAALAPIVHRRYGLLGVIAWLAALVAGPYFIRVRASRELERSEQACREARDFGA